jgi:hypothetical protein
MSRKPILKAYSGKMSKFTLDKAKKLKERTGVTLQEIIHQALEQYIAKETIRLNENKKPTKQIKKKVTRK